MSFRVMYDVWPPSAARVQQRCPVCGSAFAREASLPGAVKAYYGVAGRNHFYCPSCGADYTFKMEKHHEHE